MTHAFDTRTGSEDIDIRTAPFSRWNIENATDEPAHGYYARLVAAEGHSSITRYSNGIDVNSKSTNPETFFDVLFKLPLSGERKLRLRNATPLRREDGVWLAGQRFNSLDLSFSSRRWCPGCLQESPHHRAWWDITAIMECPLHRRALVDQDEHGNPMRWWWPVMNASPRGVMLSFPMPRQESTSTFAAYVIGRMGFAEKVEAPLLDHYDMGTVIDVCQLAGRLLSSPWTAEIPPLTPQMTEVGYQAMRLDAAVFVEAVRAWLRVNVTEELRTQGYGTVFEWAIAKWATFENRVLSDMFQKVLRKALALEGRGSVEPLTSDAFMAAEVSLAALAHRMGVSKNGIATVADMLGVLPKRDRYRGLVMFDAAEADEIEHRWHQTVGKDDAGKMLGLTGPQIKPLVDAGYLRKFSSITFEGDGGNRYLKSEIEAVIAMLEPLCVDEAGATGVSFLDYARNAEIGRGELAVSILKGQHRVAMGSTSTLGFERLMVIAEASKSTRRPLRVLQRPADVMSIGECRMELNVTQVTLARLIEEGHLKRNDIDGATGALDRAAVLEFAATHRNAAEFVPTLAVSLAEFVVIMADNGFEPLLEKRPKSEVRSVNTIYRYQDVAQAFGLKADPTRFDDPEFLAFWPRVTAIVNSLPPYLQLPSQLPVSGQLTANSKGNIAFFVTYDPVERTGVFEGRRDAAKVGVTKLFVGDQDRSLERLEDALVSLIGKSARRH